jgi:hypothetical protein
MTMKRFGARKSLFARVAPVGVDKARVVANDRRSFVWLLDAVLFRKVRFERNTTSEYFGTRCARKRCDSLFGKSLELLFCVGQWMFRLEMGKQGGWPREPHHLWCAEVTVRYKPSGSQCIIQLLGAGNIGMCLTHHVAAGVAHDKRRGGSGPTVDDKFPEGMDVFKVLQEEYLRRVALPTEFARKVVHGATTRVLVVGE